MTELDDRLREHYRDLQLSDDGLDELIQAPIGDETGQRVVAKRTALAALTSRYKSLSWAVAGMLVVVLGFGMHGFGSQAERVERLLHEAALNHSTRLEMEFESTQLASINEGMVQLPFTVSLPRQLRDSVSVLGARYCTISGQLATHLKLKRAHNDEVFSVFMTRSLDELQHWPMARIRLAICHGR